MQKNDLDRCPKCGGERIEIKLVSVGNAPIVAMQPLHDQKKLLRKHNQSPVITYTCAQCGYIELYAQTPENLKPDA